MASGTRSSKRKSSPSLKKKRRIKERSKKRSKISKGKSKKVSRRESSDSYSDNESLSSASSVSYSSTDSDSSRSRSRIRKDKSKRRSKSRRSRLRSKSSEKNTVKEKRGKRSKKSKDTDSKKKRLRKKPRREPSISSSSRSVSCSTCRSSDDSEREHERAEKEAKRRGRSRRDLGEDRRWLDGSSYMSEVQVPHPVEHNPRRLRSIIIFAKEFEEEEEQQQQREVIDRDVQKEEIVYDQDDYPSPRSNDSYDGGATRRETSAGESRYLEDPRGEMVGSKIGVSELSEGCYLGVGDSFEGHDANVSSAGAGSNNVDLEAILRQKALENLRKFKGGVRANAKKPVTTKSSCDGEVKQALGLNADLEVQEKDQEGSVGGAGALSVSHQKISALNVSAAESSQILPQDSKTLNPFEKGFVDDDRLEGGEGEASPLKEGNLGADKFAEQALPTQEKPVALCMPSTESSLLPSKNLKGRIDSVDDVLDKHETEASTLVQHLGTNKLDSEMIPIQESSLPMSVPAENKATVESVQPSNDDTKIVTDDVDNTTSEVPGSHASLEAQSSNVIENEDRDSQFQQKTMSVMRGGEMVQVSYKVYIPKHAPALARRKLKR